MSLEIFGTCFTKRTRRFDNGTAKKKHASERDGITRLPSKEKALELARWKEAVMQQNELSLALRQKH